MRKFLYLAALSIVATLAFSSVATAQYFTSDSPGDCSGAAEQLQAERPNVPDGTIEQYLKFVPDAGGCIEVDGYSPPAPLGALNAVAYDPSTGAELGLVKDLDPDLTSGANATDYREFCGTFPVPLGGQTAQDYYERDANDKEGAILDPDGDGLACTPDDEAFLSGDAGESDGGAQDQYAGEDDPQCIDGILDRDGDGQISPVEAAQAGADATQGINPCADGDPGGGGENIGDGGEPSGEDGSCAGAVASESLQEELGLPESNLEIHLSFFPDVGGCAYLANSPQLPPLKFFDAPVFDPETGEYLGLVKDLDPDLTSGDNRTTYEEFCGNFPIPEDFPVATGYTAQEYHDQLANDNEKAILDPDSDGLACTDEDEAFLSGDIGYDETEFGQIWNGLVTQIAEDGTESEFWVEANIMPFSEMTEDLIGEVVGEVSLGGLDCGGVWVLEEVNVDYVVVEERITSGATENCVEFVPITLTPRDDGTLEYYFLDMNGSVGECVLTRQGSGLPDDDDDTRKPSERMRVLGMDELPDTGGLSLFAPLGGLFLSIGIFGVATLSRRTR